MVRNKGQSATEYLLVVALALMIIVPGSMIFYSYSTDSKASLVNSQIFKVGNTLIDTGLEMYSIGDNSWQTIDVSMPEQISEVKVYNTSTYSELVITHGDSVLDSDSVFFSEVPLCVEDNCSCTEGCELNISQGINNVRIVCLDGKIYYKVQ